MVLVGIDRSSFQVVLAGVPLGSVLGPLLFILFLNDLPNYMPCKTLLCADDTSFLVTGNDFDCVDCSITEIIENGKLWFKSILLEINETKPEKVCFSLRKFGIKDEKYKPVRLLCVTLVT